MKSKVKLYTAKNIITMYQEQPFATAVAVKDDRILGVGQLSELTYWLERPAFSSYEIDNQFKDKILMPGLVDAHTHVELQALIYSGHFVAQIPWPRPEGGFFPVYATKTDVLNRLKALDKELPPDHKRGAALYFDHAWRAAVDLFCS